VLVALVLVIVVGSLTIDGVGNPRFYRFVILEAIPIALIALPMTLIVITGEIDLSVASTVGLTCSVMGQLWHSGVTSFPVLLTVSLLLGAVLGAVNGIFVTVFGLPSLAVTIGTLALYRGIAVGLLGTKAVTDFPERWTDLAKERIRDGSSYPMILLPFIVLLVLFVLLLHFSSFGRGIYEVGLNDEAAHFTGVNVERTKFWLFVMAGAVSAFAGVYFTLRFGTARGDNATGLELQVIAAVLLGGVSIFGGRGALHGVVAGVLLIGVLSSAMRLEGITVNITNIVIGLLLVASVVSTSVLAWASGLRARRNPRGASPRSAPGGVGTQGRST